MDYKLLRHQAEVIRSDKKLTFLGAGVGAGKTDIGTIWLLRELSKQPEGVLSLITANTYPQLWDSTLRNVLKNLKRFNVPHFPDEVPRAYAPRNFFIYIGGAWREVLCRSLENYKGLSGVELGTAWLDEVWQTKEEAVDVVLARCRDTRVRNRLLYTTTLDDPTTWMYDKFVSNFDGDLMEVIYATTFDNPNLPEGYADDLKAFYSERLFDRMVLAKWVSLESGQVFYAFERTGNVSKLAEFEPELPIYWSLDFNVSEGAPMSSALIQIKKGKGPDGTVRPEAHQFDEIIVESADTHAAIEEFLSRPWLERSKVGGPEAVVINGDATGRAKDSRSRTTDYKILADEGFTKQNVPKANPPLRTSHNETNALLCSADGDRRYLLHPRCKISAKGLETVKLKAGALYLEKETPEQHVTTAIRYFVNANFPMEPKRLTSEKATGVFPLARGR